MANPFTPGNGIEPAFLAGREEQITEFVKSLRATEEGLPRNTVLYGLRGTGKTVLLRHYKLIAESNNWLVLSREFLERYSDEKEFGEAFGKDLAEVASETSIKKKLAETGKMLFDLLKPEELSAYGIKYKPYYTDRKEILEDYVADLLQSNWPVFEKAGKKGVIFLYDEFHLVTDKKEDKQYVLSSLLSAFSKVQREGLKYYLCLSGLPTLKTNLKEAKTYTERMFIFQKIEYLEASEAEKALKQPLRKTGYSFEAPLVERIVSETMGYPYFIQFYGYMLIDGVDKRSISLADFEKLKSRLVKSLDQSFFEDRFNSASGMEKRVLVAMAKCEGAEAIAATNIARKAKTDYSKMQYILLRLIDKGLIYRSHRGYYAFSIPLFKGYLLRQS